MTDSPPTNPDADQADQAARSVQEQLDALLVQLETAEPGTVDPSALPAGFVPQPATADAPGAAEQAFEQALTADPSAQASSASPAAEDADDSEAKSETESAAEQEMLAMLNQSLQGLATDAEAQPDHDAATEPTGASADPPASPDPPTPEPASSASSPGDDSETQMLAALNTALQDLNPQTPSPPAAPGAAEPADDAQGEIDALLAAPPQPASAESESAAGVQDPINALLDQPAATTADTEPASVEPDADVDADAASSTTSTQDQIAQEIEGLLDAGAGDGAAPDEPTIDDLDQMLAEEIDEDDELAGDFASVEAITAGIVTDTDNEALEVDEHAASASAVAAELDSQPEDTAAGASGDEDPMATIAAIAETAQRNADAAEARPPRDWRGMLERGKQRLLEACFVINWPARRFLSPEYRATLGYIALLNLFFAAATWFALILF